MFKVDKKKPEIRHCQRSGVFIVKFELTSPNFLVLILIMTLSVYLFALYRRAL